jgi:acrylyl-CoA reductase (NADPH)
MTAFRALVLRRQAGRVDAAVEQLTEDQLPDGDVTVDVRYSTLNYKDALIIRNAAPMVRAYPHVPGIDFAGTVRESCHPDFTKGDPVVLTGWGVGERRFGGYAERARVDGDWLVPLPAGLTLERAMAIGTAGLSAMLAVLALEDHGLRPGRGEVLVTGGAGGVGSIAIAVLANLGYQVAASTGRPDSHAILRNLGAKTLIDRAELGGPAERPLEAARFAGCVDAVGGQTLARVLGQLAYGGALAAVGNAAGSTFEGNVLPFLLRGVNVLGINSGQCPRERRLLAWQRLARDLPIDQLDRMTRRAGLDDLPQLADQILSGRIAGRLLIATH